MDPILGSALIEGAFSLFNKPKRPDNPLADAVSRQYRRYAPLINQLLWSLSQQGGLTPGMQAQQRLAEDDANRYYRQALTGTQRALVNRGLGTSSLMGNALAALGARQADTLARARTALVPQIEQRQLDAIRLLLGGVGSNVGGAMSTQANADQWYNSAYGNWMNQLGGYAGDIVSNWPKEWSLLKKKTTPKTPSTNTPGATVGHGPFGDARPNGWENIDPGTIVKVDDMLYRIDYDPYYGEPNLIPLNS